MESEIENKQTKFSDFSKLKEKCKHQLYIEYAKGVTIKIYT